jgi:hypothetical protein
LSHKKGIKINEKKAIIPKKATRKPATRHFSQDEHDEESSQDEQEQEKLSSKRHRKQ